MSLGVWVALMIGAWVALLWLCGAFAPDDDEPCECEACQ